MRLSATAAVSVRLRCAGGAGCRWLPWACRGVGVDVPVLLPSDGTLQLVLPAPTLTRPSMHYYLRAELLGEERGETVMPTAGAGRGGAAPGGNSSGTVFLFMLDLPRPASDPRAVWDWDLVRV